MSDQLIKTIKVDFDINNHHELSPYVYFTEPALYLVSQLIDDSIPNQDPSHSQIMNDIIRYTLNYINEPGLLIQNYQENKSKLFNIFKRSIFYCSSRVENLFTGIIDNLQCTKYDLISLCHVLKLKLVKDLRKLPISTELFPKFSNEKSNLTEEELNQRKKDEEKMNVIISKKSEFSLNDLSEFYKTIRKYKKCFSFSPSFIITCIRKLDIFLYHLINPNEPSQNSENESIVYNDQDFFKHFMDDSEFVNNGEKMKYFRLVLLIKMRLYMMIHKTADFLIILIELLIIDERNPKLDLENDQFSFKSIVDEILPDTKKRSKIFTNISMDEIVDFCFSHDSLNDFILTKNGLFKLNYENNDIVKFEEKLKLNTTNTKIAISDKILYVVSQENQLIYKIPITQKEENNKTKEEKNNKKENYGKERKRLSPKNLRKKNYKKNEKIEKEGELNLDNISIKIPDYPIISVSYYDDYIRIIQKKSSNNEKETFLLTSVDLNPNGRIDYDIEKAFYSELFQSTSQAQFEFDIENKDKKYKVSNLSQSKDNIFVSYEDSTFEQWIIYRNGTIELSKSIENSPYIFNQHSQYKFDNNMFLYVIEAISNSNENGIFVFKMHFPSTKYNLRSENKLFLKYPFLQKLSDIADNCTHFIINKKITSRFTTKEYYESKKDDEKKAKKPKIQENPFEFTISPSEMSSMVETVGSLTSHLDYIKYLINNLRDEDLKRFFICLSVKICGISLLYGTTSYYITKYQMGELTLQKFEKFKSFIIDLFSSYGTSNSFNFEIMIRESILITISIAGKFIFLPNSYEELHSFLNKILETSNYSQSLIRSLSYLMFTYPSSLYIINDRIFNELLKFDDEINLHRLFENSILFTKLENRFAKSVINKEFIQNIKPYYQYLFKYIKYSLNNESIPIAKAEQLLIWIFGFEFNNCMQCLLLMNEFNNISKDVFDRISKIKEVKENDNDYYNKYKNLDDIRPRNVTKSTQILESKHPFILSISEEDKKDEVETDLGIIKFNTIPDKIYFIPDNQCKFLEGDKITFYLNNLKSDTKTFEKESDFIFNQAIELNAQTIKITLTRQKEKIKDSCWGYKFTFIGASFNNSLYWKPNEHLYFYGFFISCFFELYLISLRSTPTTDEEQEFKVILENKLIQGIKLEEIDNYESNNAPKKTRELGKRKLSRGISRGINYDIDNDSLYDDSFKKSFINDLITVDDNKMTGGKLLFDILYTKTARQNIIRLSQGAKSILINEHYLAACLFKQLGMINTCIKLINSVDINQKNDSKYENIEIPSRLKSLWRNIYSLRKTLYFEYQKSKSNRNRNKNDFDFTQFSEEVKRKCKLLLYSDPILKFQENDRLNDEAFESATKSIMSFITSKKPLSKITDLIDIQRKRLSISTQAISLLSQFLEKKLLFKSSIMHVLETIRNQFPYFNSTKALSDRELDEFKKQFGKTNCFLIKTLYNDPTISVLLYKIFLKSIQFDFFDDESLIELFKIVSKLYEENKDKNSFVNNRFNDTLFALFILIGCKVESNELIDYFKSFLLSSKNIRIKNLVLIAIFIFVKLYPENQKLLDRSIPFSILFDNHQNPTIVRSIFYWLSQVVNNDQGNLSLLDEKNPYLLMKPDEFIKTVLISIGNAFCGHKCIFIDESFQQITHRQVAEGMVAFVRILSIQNIQSIFDIFNEILIKTNKSKLDDFKDDEINILIGIFASLCQGLSAFEPGRFFNNGYNSILSIIGYNTTENTVRLVNSRKDTNCISNFNNSPKIDYRFLNLTDKDINNILQLHSIVSNSKYFTHESDYEKSITDREIKENVLISAFYSFLPMIFQNINNADILLNSNNIRNSLSLFEFSMNKVPLKENNLVILSHYLEKGIINHEIKKFDKNRFLKMNFGEIVLNGDHDLIKTNKNRQNLFIYNRPFEFQTETYFEVKINKIGNKQIFFGFVDSEECSINQAFGFGSIRNEGTFYRVSPFLSNNFNVIGDTLMLKEKNIQLNENDLIGLYYTPKYCYLVINRKMTQYRLFHTYNNSYVPLIYVDHNEIELEITENVTSLIERFDFLDMNKYDSNYFTEKDIKESIQIITEEKYGDIYENDFMIGQQVYINQIVFSAKQSKLENIEGISPTFIKYLENYGIIRDIIPLTQFISKLKIETYNHLTLSNEIIEIESRYVQNAKTNFFNLIENQINAKLGFNGSFDMKYLPDKLKNCSDFNEITNYLRNKTIKDNSKSIAIIMNRYLVMILVDYLRYSKSPLLQDEHINCDEMNVIIKSLAYSLPTISIFKPKFTRSLDQYAIDENIIFSDKSDIKNIEDNALFDKNTDTRNPGNRKTFSYAFQLFLKLSENFLSKHFLSKLLKELFECFNNNESIESSALYESIPSKMKIETIVFDKFKFAKEIDDNFMYNNKIVGMIPILLSSIPYQLPCIKCFNKRIRQSSDQISYFISTKRCDKSKWKYDLSEETESLDEIKNYQLKFGMFFISKLLDEEILSNSLGYIQIVFLILQVFDDSNSLYEKNEEMLKNELINHLFSLSKIKNPITTSFISNIIVFLMSKITISSETLIKQTSIPMFSQKSTGLFELTSFPDSNNEIPLLLSIFSTLIQTQSFELSIEDRSEDKISSLFNKYYEINDEIFKVCNDSVNKKTSKYIEGDVLNNENGSKKKKNFRLLYLAYYYSILLVNQINLPYPKFLFVHDWLMQYFGGFRIVLSRIDINQNKKDSDDVVYKSKIFDNKVDLDCSYKFISLIDDGENEEKSKDKNKKDSKDNEKSKDKFSNYKIMIHQITNDMTLELPRSGECIQVSFPLELIVIKEKNEKEKDELLRKGDIFVVSFAPSKQKQHDCFTENFLLIEKDYDNFMALSKYDNEISDQILSLNDKKNNSENNNVNNNNSENTNENRNANFNENNNNNNNENTNTDSTITNNENNNDNSNSNNENTNSNTNNNENTNTNSNINNNENNNDNNSINENTNNNNNENNSANNNQNGDSANQEKENELNEYKMYEIEKIPETLPIQLSSLFNDRIVCLRSFVLSTYRRLIEDILTNYELNDDSNSNNDDNTKSSSYLNQIISPAYSMESISKFKFINKLLSNDQNNDGLDVVFNRFEQQKFLEKLKEEKDDKNKQQNEEILSTARPLFVQFMEQIDENSLPLLKNHNSNPFTVDLIGENSYDAGGPGREIVTQLIEELMNPQIGIFTVNPNARHNNEMKNKEDLIPNSSNYNYNNNKMNFIEEISEHYPDRFIYAGALIAVCFMSSIPQPMKLSMLVWEYLTQEKISIESIYEIDDDFRVIIKNGEAILKSIKTNPNKVTEELFQQIFTHSFEIEDSFGKNIELIPSGSKIRVTKENLNEFIEKAKRFRLDEFLNELKQLKEGFDKVIAHKNIAKILRPNELKLLVCGEPDCKIDQLKTCIDFNCDENVDEEKIKPIFWNVMESFSIQERLDFIRFSSGRLSLPPPGLSMPSNIVVHVFSPGTRPKAGDKMAYAHTCFSTIDIPFFDNEEKLASILRSSISSYGLITDVTENIASVLEFL